MVLLALFLYHYCSWNAWSTGGTSHLYKWRHKCKQILLDSVTGESFMFVAINTWKEKILSGRHIFKQNFNCYTHIHKSSKFSRFQVFQPVFPMIGNNSRCTNREMDSTQKSNTGVYQCHSENVETVIFTDQFHTDSVYHRLCSMH